MNEAAVEVRVREARGIPRLREPVTVGVPLPRGAVHDVGALSIEGSDGLAPVQALVTDRWADGSARWVLLDFPLSLGARAQCDLRLRFSPAPAAVEPAVHVTDSTEGP